MDGERYVVELDLKRGGDFGLDQLDGRLKRSERGAEKLKAAWRDLGSGVSPFASALDTVASKTMGVARTLGMVGGVAMLSGATYGVANLNNELEKTEISLGTILSANGMASSVPIGIERAKALIGDMRKDAQKLPGEFDDLLRIFTTGAIPAFHSGATVDQWRGISSQAMAAGKVFNMDLHQAAREMTLLLEGRAGTQNTFGTKLGIKAEGFNEKSSTERLKILETELGKYSGSIAEFANTYDAQSSTLIDNLKSFARQGTSSLFVSVKDAMRDANVWFERHQAEAIMFASRWGSRLAGAFEDGKRFLLEWGPIVADFGNTAYERVTAAWVDVQPYAQKFGEIVKGALEDPNGTIDKLIELAKLWAALKVGTSLVGGMANGGVKGGLITGGTALAAYGLANGALNGQSSGSYVESVAGGTAVGFGMGGAKGAAAGALLGAAASLAQTYQNAADSEADFRARMAAEAEEWNTDMRRFYAANGWTAAEAEKAMRDHGLMIQKNISEVDNAAGLVAGSIYNTAAAIEAANYAFNNAADKRTDEIGSYWGNMLRLSTQNAQAEREMAAGAGGKGAAKHKHKGGGSGVMKVEIVVTSNAHPNRVAREVVGELGRRVRLSGSSPHVTNFAALERG